MIEVGLSLSLCDDFAAASHPLFAAQEVEVLEWSFDRGWGLDRPLRPWATALIDGYAAAGALLGHGVSGSLFSGEWTARQRQWMERLRRECQTRAYRHVSEHFGFMTAGEFEFGPPLPLPMTDTIVELGQRRLAELGEASQGPVGLENLALALSRADLLSQGEFLDRLLDPVDGFLVLDLHNLWCQVHNFELDPASLLDSFPLERVREIHVSGGSFSEALGSGRRVRRDTHDGDVPEEVFSLLELAISRCAGLETIILERVDDTMQEAPAREKFREDFRRIRRLVDDR